MPHPQVLPFPHVVVERVIRHREAHAEAGLLIELEVNPAVDLLRACSFASSRKPL